MIHGMTLVKIESETSEVMLRRRRSRQQHNFKLARKSDADVILSTLRDPMTGLLPYKLSTKTTAASSDAAQYYDCSCRAPSAPSCAAVSLPTLNYNVEVTGEYLF